MVLRIEARVAISFSEQLLLTVIDKALIGGLLAIAGFFFSRALEKFKGTQLLELEAFRGAQLIDMAGFTQEQNRKIEEFKSRLLMESESQRNLRAAVAEVAKRLAAASHCICWTTWPPKYAPRTFKKEDLDKYDREIHLLLSEIVGARVVLAALSPNVHDQLSHLVDRLYDLDVRMGEAKSALSEDPERGTAALANIHSAAGKLEDDLLRTVAELRMEPRRDGAC